MHQIIILMKAAVLKRKVLNFLFLSTFVIFIFGFFKYVGVGHPVLYVLLGISLLFKLIKIFFEWYHFSTLKTKGRPEKYAGKKTYTVDMLTTACPGEPFEMIEATLKGMVSVRYPHTNYLCDEGNDPKLKALCNKLGVIHITRETHENAKAGNINNALKSAKGELCVILDPDHVPFPDFLDYVVGAFDDPKVGYAQVVQAYKNQADSLVAQGAAEQTYLFYGPYMEAMSEYGTAQAIGANCTFRRVALDSIGGHAAGLTEDMHTSMLLHAKGWTSVYVPKVLSLGLVPNSLGAFYQQQLKWSRGTFDLLFNVVPGLFSKFSLRQKIHYSLVPLYFLSGLIGLVDVGVPIYSLISGDYPWELNPVVFFAIFTPFLIVGLYQRYDAQKWLHDAEEKGIHLMGGFLRLGTWWIYLTGFIYTLINVKVPYIPTPKEHSSKGDFVLGLPNLVIALLSFSAAFYGLNKDWQPYSFLMAGFALVNGFSFSFAFFMGQSDIVRKSRYLWYDFKNIFVLRKAELTYVKLSTFSFPVAIVLPAFFSLFLLLNAVNFKLDLFDKVITSELDKERGGFYLGIFLPSFDDNSDTALIHSVEQKTGAKMAIVSTYLSWSDESLPVDQWDAIIQEGHIPMITWEPWTNLFENQEEVPELKENKKVFKHITEGVFDDYIHSMAYALKALDAPVFLRFAHEMDNPMYPWSATGENTPEEFKEAWEYIHYKFETIGVQNVTWVFNPWSPAAVSSYFPYGKDSSITELVDWIGLTALNYDSAAIHHKSLTFKEIYLPFRKEIKQHQLELPVMLAEFGATNYSYNAAGWVNESLPQIREDYAEINALVLFYSDRDKNWITNWRPDAKASNIDWTFDLESVASELQNFDPIDLNGGFSSKVQLASEKRVGIGEDKGGFVMYISGEPFYMKGICYNNGHDWEEGFKPLSRKQVQEDFNKIKASGANTIRRYEPSIYDRNIFKEANAHELKIMYGFWFDPKTDYFSDHSTLADYKEKVLKNVRKNKGQKNIIAWNIGNETWGLLKKYYGEPYLTIVRRKYISFLENLAVEIHEIDPNRPVFSSEEHDNVRLLAAIHDFKHYAPSIDAIGVNSYYEDNISQLSEIFQKYYPESPYVVTEFGPKGYWNKELGDFRNDTLLIELSSKVKGQSYQHQWETHIEGNKGKNLGGFAFSWQDRFEGTATWFGITDFNGNLKPSYHFLSSAWKKEGIPENAFPDLYIVGQWPNLIAGEKIWLSAATLSDYPGKLKYEWKVYEDETWKNYNPVLNEKEAFQYVEIEMPKNKSRVYLYAYDEHGNVITASRPLVAANY